MENTELKQTLIKIWPTIYRIINTVFYFLITTIKNIVLYAIKQIKGI